MPAEVSTLKLRVLCPPSEYSPPYLQGMLNRIAVSHHKYGLLADNFPHRVNALGCLDQCVAKYRETGNTEYLIDAGNYAMFEFMFPSIEGAYFKATDADGSAGVVYNEQKEK